MLNLVKSRSPGLDVYDSVDSIKTSARNSSLTSSDNRSNDANLVLYSQSHSREWEANIRIRSEKLVVSPQFLPRFPALRKTLPLLQIAKPVLMRTATCLHIYHTKLDRTGKIWF